MHIAICDDNVADRKQTERLMGREADKWIAEGEPMYTYSYGSVKSLLDNFMQFDAVLMDIKETEGVTTADVIDELVSLGATSTMVVLDEEKNYIDIPRDILFLPKPLRPVALHEIMLKVKENSSHREALIELRGERETLYVKESDVLYAEEKGRYTHVTMLGNKEIKILNTVESLYSEIEPLFSGFVCPSRKIMINMRYLKDYSLLKIVMEDGKTFTVGTVAKRLYGLAKEYK